MAIKVAFFDCDGTLTKVKSSWEYLHRRLNIWDDFADHYQALFREGRIDYREFCRRDALLWRGLPVERVRLLLKDIPYQDGSLEVVRSLRARGVKTIILSTGLSLVVDKVKEDLGFDGAHANELLLEDGFITGDIRVNVDYEEKGRLVQRILEEVGASREEACAVGDGDGDLGMFEAVGLSVGFCPTGTFSRPPSRIIREESLKEVMAIIEDYEG
jgi:phosphoserine phosphatase